MTEIGNLITREHTPVNYVQQNMKVFTLFLAAALISPAVAQDLLLRIEPPADPIHVREQSRFTITVTNQGEKAVTLVQPGDGSNSKWRTPVVGWSVLSMDEPEKKHPEEPPLFMGARCGNINPFKLEQVFTLNSGERRELGLRAGSPRFETAGTYRVRFYYQNIPDLPVRRGILLGKHEPGAVEAIRDSDACNLVSNELIVRVLPGKERL